MLARNLAANAATQIWAFLLNILALPLYLRLLGPEPYALLGFGLTIQIWTTLLDAGMSPTLSRDMARLRSGKAEERDVHSFVRSLDWICLALIGAVSTIGYLTRDWWAESWFQDHQLSEALVGQVMAMVILFCMLRWAAGLYRSAVMGLERQVLANAVFAAASTVRLLGAVPIVYVTQDIRALFAIWVVAAAAELVLFRWIVSRAFAVRLPWLHFSLASLKGRAGLAGSIAFLSLVWILVTQLDKLILARILPLGEYGYFTLAVVLSNAMLMLPVPISQAIQPRMTAAAATGDTEELGRLFRMGTQMITAVALAPAIVLSALPETAISTWTGSADAAKAVRSFLGLYVLGSSIGGVTGVLYMIQLAYGNVRLHVAFNVVFAIVLIPTVIFVASRFGAPGAAWLWFGLNLFVLITYPPLVLRRFLPGVLTRWYLIDIGAPLMAAILVSAAARILFDDTPGLYLADLVVLIATGAATFAAAALATPIAREWLAARGLPRKALR